GHRAAGPLFRPALRRTDAAADRGDSDRDPGRDAPLPVARKRPRAREPDRAGGDSLVRPTPHGPARAPRPPVYPGGAGRERVDARGSRAGAHHARARGDELDARRPAGRRRAPRDEADDSSVLDEAAGDRPPRLMTTGVLPAPRLIRAQWSVLRRRVPRRAHRPVAPRATTSERPRRDQ